MGLASDLAKEQWALLRRDRRGWGEHLAHIRGFLGEGLQAGGAGPAVILGAGSGLEVPWKLAPPGSVGWDADPWSRAWTLARHRRWAPWVFADLTGGFAELAEVSRRAALQPWSGRLRPTRKAALRLAGLLETLHPDAGPLRRWLRERRPGRILAANVMGQFGVVAQRVVEKAFAGRSPWVEDPELRDPLAVALDAWTARAVRAFLGALADSGADLWLVHDRGVLFGPSAVALGPLTDPWLAQVRAATPLEASDSLCGVEVRAEFPGREVERHQRWLWPVAPEQVHVMEALRVPGRPAGNALR